MKSGRLVLYLGGIRSGKSGAALRRVQAAKRAKVAYLATALPNRRDAGLARRLADHQAARPASWPTLEGFGSLLEALKMCARRRFDVLLLDGLGMLLARQLKRPEAEILDETETFAKGCRFQAVLTVVVADEVGEGGVPGHPVARRFADLNGLVNQRLAALADEVWQVRAGIATRLR